MINENTDLTFDQLKKLFNRMTAFYGGLQFKNTQFTNFSMFSVDAGSNVFDFSCKACKSNNLLKGQKLIFRRSNGSQ